MSKIKIKNIRHLALEGGGGRGFAFLGAIQKMKELGILKYDKRKLVSGDSGINSIAGSSAGAITALFLSCGFDDKEIAHELKTKKFSKFFDSPSISRRHGIYKGYKSTKRCTNTMRPTILPTGLDQTIDWLLGAIVGLITDNKAFEEIAKNRQHLTNLLACDWGIFTGETFTEYFNYVLWKGYFRIDSLRNAYAMKSDDYIRNHSNEAPSMTFSAHYDMFNIKFGVMTSNLETGKSVLFSKETTPNFPVATAVRMSMGLPLLFKPVLLRQSDFAGSGDQRAEESHLKQLQNVLPNESFGKDTSQEYQGVYVDGGYFNNIPLCVFPENTRENTLGLSLEIEKPSKIESYQDFLLNYPLKFGVFGAGESQVHSSLNTTDQTIILDTEGLSLFDFSVPDNASTITRRSAEAVETFFYGGRSNFLRLLQSRPGGI